MKLLFDTDPDNNHTMLYFARPQSPMDYYLRQGGYVLPGDCLAVCLLAASRKNYRSKLGEKFTRDLSVDREELVKFWKSSASALRDI